MSDYVELSNLTKIYPTPKGPAVIVKDFNLRIRKGEFVCLIGHSGCGKSTVLSMLAGLNEISGGGIVLAGKEAPGIGGLRLSRGGGVTRDSNPSDSPSVRLRRECELVRSEARLIRKQLREAIEAVRAARQQRWPSSSDRTGEHEEPAEPAK